MSDPRLDAETAERMLRGEPAGPRELAQLLAAASSGLTAQDLNREDTAVAAFRQARSRHPARPRTRRFSALVSLKAALIGLALVLAGGVTAATTSQRLPGPFGDEPAHSTRTPMPPRTRATQLAPAVPSPSRPPSPTPPRATHSERTPAAPPGATAQPKKGPHPTEKPKSKASKNKAPEVKASKSKSPKPHPRTTRPVPATEHQRAGSTGPSSSTPP
jgi:hypothetical protein